MASLSYATSSSGPSAGGIGWINFGTNFSISPGTTITGESVTLLDGSTMTFNISNTAISNGGFTYTAVPTPTVADAAFGVDAYTGISGQVCLQTNTAGTNRISQITLSNISVLDTSGNPVPNYSIVVVDGEVTNAITEQQQYITNGGVWSQFYIIDPLRNGPTIAGVGSPIVTLSGLGVAAGLAAAPVFTTTNPTSVSASIATDQQEAVAFGVAITKVSISKVINSRYSSTDQFNLSILGTPSNTVTTIGSSIGLQPISANVFGLVSNTYSINESMAVGSFGTLTNYNTTVVWSNLATDGTAGPNPGALGNNITLALGDVLTATITNTSKTSPPGRGVNFI